eukprot:scaffold1519_cov250-Pinguiococcus_pyrenoidosus.AAC.3
MVGRGARKHSCSATEESFSSPKIWPSSLAFTATKRFLEGDDTATPLLLLLLFLLIINIVIVNYGFTPGLLDEASTGGITLAHCRSPLPLEAQGARHPDQRACDDATSKDSSGVLPVHPFVWGILRRMPDRGRGIRGEERRHGGAGGRRRRGCRCRRRVRLHVDVFSTPDKEHVSIVNVADDPCDFVEREAQQEIVARDILERRLVRRLDEEGSGDVCKSAAVVDLQVVRGAIRLSCSDDRILQRDQHALKGFRGLGTKRSDLAS